MRFATAVALALALTACGTDIRPGSTDPIETSPDAGTGDPASTVPDGGSAPGDGGQQALTDCQEAVQHSDLAWIQDKVFNASCLTGCHSGANASSGMDLSAGRAWASVVNVPSNQYSGWTRVVPGDSRASMLMVQLGGESGPMLEGYMPWGQARLCTEKIDAIRRWIGAGAPQ